MISIEYLLNVFIGEMEKNINVSFRSLFISSVIITCPSCQARFKTGHFFERR